MKKFFEIMAWCFTLAIAMTIFFVKAPKVSGVSGGQQAAAIIDSSSGGIAKVVTSLEGGS